METTGHWEKLKILFVQATKLPPEAREVFLDEHCQDAPDLRLELVSLLANYEEAPEGFEGLAGDAADAMLASLMKERARDSSEARPSLIGRTLSHYEVLDKLGVGGMGIVYKAHDTRLKRTVALKFLPLQWSHHAEARKRFEHEAQAASALDHPNIATIHEIGETDDGDLFIAMAYYQGQTLKQKIEQGPLPLDEALNYTEQVALGLAKAHAQGIIHRDIKPANVMVTDEERIKILDFGLAKMTDVKITKTGVRMGTLAYMSPEQTLGEKVDHRTDLWSLGVVLYEMITGQRPFQDAYEEAVRYSILYENPEPLSMMRTDLPETLEALVAKALEKPRAKRYQETEEMLAELGAIRREIAGESGSSGDVELRTLLPPVPAPVERYMVGREQEQAALHTALDTVVAGRGLLLCVAGEPGIGKTMLVEDFLDQVTTTGPPCTIARGRCSERLAGTEAYLPVLETLEDLLTADKASAPLLRKAAPTWYGQLRPMEASEAITRASSQERMKRELGGFLQDLARLRPLVLFIDDLHWSDVSTVDLLAYLATKFDGTPMLIVVTYRPSDLLLAEHPFSQIKLDLLARGRCREITLGFLSPQEIEHYLALEYPDHTFPADFSKFISAQTDGSPLFMVNLVRYLQDRDEIVEAEGHWRLAHPVSEIQFELPESIRGMIQRKLSRLDKTDHRLLVVASVQGSEFDSAVVAGVLSLEAAEVEERLDTLERHYQLVQMIDEREFPDGTLTVRYRFVHALYQNALYGALMPTRRASFSRAVAEALLAHYGKQGGAVASALAVLLEAAREPERAAAHYRMAARNATRVYAYQEAIMLARRGLALLETLPETLERSGKELDLLMALAPALVASRGYAAPEVQETYTQAQKLCRQIGKLPPLSRVLYGISTLHVVRAEHQKAREPAEELFSVAQRLNDPVLLPLAHRALGVITFHMGEFADARVHTEQGIALYDPQQHGSQGLIGDTRVTCLVYTALTLWHLGYPDQAVERIDEALELTHALAKPHLTVLALNYATTFNQFRRDMQACQKYAEACIALSLEHGFPLFGALGTVMRGRTLAEQGQTEEAIAQIHQGIEAWRATGAELCVPWFLALQAEAHGKAVQPEEGLTLLAEAATRVNKTEERFNEAELHRIKGELLLMQGTAEADVEDCFHRALKTARRQESKVLELRAAVSLGRLWQQQGRHAEAGRMLQEIYHWFTEGFDTTDLREAQALLNEVS